MGSVEEWKVQRQKLVNWKMWNNRINNVSNKKGEQKRKRTSEICGTVTEHLSSVP